MAKAGELYGQPWSEREYIIVLDSYVRHKGGPCHHLCDYVLELSRMLKRTPGSIVMRMENFASLDPEVQQRRVGLKNVGPMCKKVFNAWFTRQDHLRSCAEVLLREASAGRTLGLFDPSPVALPKAFDRYELLDFIGDGGFGTVFSCIDTETQQLRAIKIIRTDRVYEDEVRHRFGREIRALKSVSHQHVIRVHEDNLESQKEFPAFVMDWAESNLQEYLHDRAETEGGRQRPTLGTAEAAAIMFAVADALACLHANEPSIIHRDVNPNNILKLPNGRWVLADFSLAKFIHAAPVSTSFASGSGMGLGTAYYAAPEQYRDLRNTDVRTDIYALGVLLWELFSASWPPFAREAPMLPEPLEPLFLKATSRAPEDRHASIPEFRETLHSAIQELA